MSERALYRGMNAAQRERHESAPTSHEAPAGKTTSSGQVRYCTCHRYQPMTRLVRGWACEVCGREETGVTLDTVA
jgi:hypothetical protein